MAKPIQDLVVQSNRDSRLSSVRRNNGATCGLRKIVLFPHFTPRIVCAHPALPSRRNHANVLSPPGIDDDKESPQRICRQGTKRSSSSVSSSSRVKASSSSNAVTASANSTPCLRKFARPYPRPTRRPPSESICTTYAHIKQRGLGSRLNCNTDGSYLSVISRLREPTTDNWLFQSAYGSSASRTRSPMMLNAATVVKMAIPGKSTSHQA